MGADDYNQEPDHVEEITGAPDPDYNYVYDQSPDQKKKHGMPEEPEPRRKQRSWPLLLSMGCLGLCCLCCIVPFCLFGVAAGGIAAVASNSEATVTTTTTLDVDADSPVRLSVDNPVGATTIERGSSEQVEVSITKRAFGWNSDRAQRELDNIDVDVTQPEPNTINVGVDTGRTDDTFWSNANNVEMTIRVPENVYLTVENDLGAINVDNVHAEMLDLYTSLGGIVFEGTIGSDPDASLSIETSTGAVAVRLPRNVYVRIDARANVGDINVSGAFDSVTIEDEQTSGSDVRWIGTLGSGEGDPPTLRLRSSTGAITVEPR